MNFVLTFDFKLLQSSQKPIKIPLYPEGDIRRLTGECGPQG